MSHFGSLGAQIYSRLSDFCMGSSFLQRTPIKYRRMAPSLEPFWLFHGPLILQYKSVYLQVEPFWLYQLPPPPNLPKGSPTGSKMVPTGSREDDDQN